MYTVYDRLNLNLLIRDEWVLKQNPPTKNTKIVTHKY